MLVTGASGFIGWHVADQVDAELGAIVRALIRPTTARREEAFEWVEGDLLQRDSLDEAMRNCRYVFHVAGDYRFWARDQREIFANNVQGTINVLEAAKEAEVENIVYTSTTGILKRGTLADSRPKRRLASPATFHGAVQALQVRSLLRSATTRRGRLADRDRAADRTDRTA